MRYKLFACDVLRREVEALCAELGKTPADFGAEFLEMGLHDQPEKLNAELKRRVAALRGASHDAILLLFGLCSNGIVGVEAPGIPLVVVRAHDCITLFLGSRARYAEEHAREAGTYWFARGFMDREMGGGVFDAALGGLTGLGAGEGDAAGVYSPGRREAIRRDFVERYGEDNADFLMEELVDAWKKNYRRAVLLTWDGDDRLEFHRGEVRGCAGENGWRYEEMPVDLRLVRGLLSEAWRDSADYMIVPPGERIRAAHDEQVLGCCAGCGESERV